jgi:hypothetical protein
VSAGKELGEMPRSALIARRSDFLAMSGWTDKH